MAEHFGNFFQPLATYTNTIAPPAAMTLNLGAIHPWYASAEFEYLYMKHLAENMTNQNWVDINLEQRMWISRFCAFNYLYEFAVFPEWQYTPLFNATIEATRRRREEEKGIIEAALVITRARSLSDLLKPDLAELSNDFLPEQSNKQASPKKTPQKRPQVAPQENSISIRKVGTGNDALYISILAANASTFAGFEGRNCTFWVKELLGISEISVVGQVEPQQGMCKVAIISSRIWGRGSRERARNLVNEFNFKSQSGALSSCEWLRAVAVVNLGTGGEEKMKMAERGQMIQGEEEKKGCNGGNGGDGGNSGNGGNGGRVGWGGDVFGGVVVDKRNKRRRKRGSRSTTEILLAGGDAASSLGKM